MALKFENDSGPYEKRFDRRGEPIKVFFDEPVHVDVCVDDGTDVTILKSFSDVTNISSWASHINLYDAHNKKPVMKSSFMKCRKAKSPDKMRATGVIEQIDDKNFRLTVAKNQYKFKRIIKPFEFDEGDDNSTEE